MKFSLAEETADQVHRLRGTFTSLVVVAVLAAVNFLANRYNKSYDSTSNKQFSLSDQTIKVVKEPEEATSRSPTSTRARASRRRATCWTATQTLSPKVKVDYVDPVRKPQLAKAAGFRRDAPILIDSGASQGRGQEPHRRGDHRRADPLAQDRRAQRRASSPAVGEHGIDDSGAQRLLGAEGSAGAQQLQDPHDLTAGRGARRAAGAPKPGEAQVVPAPAAGKPEVPKDCSVLVVGGPRYAYTQPAVDAIKAYVENGGHALLHARSAAQHGPRGDQPPTRSWRSCWPSWGVTRQQGPGARYQRHRPDLPARPGSAAGGELRVARHRARDARGGHGLPAGPHAGGEDRRQDVPWRSCSRPPTTATRPRT